VTQAANTYPPEDSNVLTALTAMLLSEDPLENLLTRVGQLAAQDLTWVQSCGVTTTVDGRVRTVASTNDLAREMDQLQDDAREGPCLTALETGGVVTIANCDVEARYAVFAREAADAGVHCVLALPLKVGDDVIGVLNMYGSVAHEFDSGELRMGQLFAAQAALVITAVARYGDQVQLAGNLEAALNSRAAIDQAIGVLMAAHHCSPATAFGRLREASQHRNVKLRVVAAETLAATQVPTQSGREGR